MLLEECLKNFGIARRAGFTEHITRVRSAVVMVVSKGRAASAQAVNRGDGHTMR